MRLGVMCSGNGTNFENIVKQCPDHEVVLMIHNKEECGAKRKAYDLGIPACHIKSKDEHLISITFQALEVDLIVMAGWMRIVGKELIDSFNDRIINIHPSLLPKYGGKGMYGKRVHEKVVENNEKESGITIHYVNKDYDQGRVIFQKKVELEKGECSDSLSKKIQSLEHLYFPKIIEKTILK